MEINKARFGIVGTFLAINLLLQLPVTTSEVLANTATKPESVESPTTPNLVETITFNREMLRDVVNSIARSSVNLGEIRSETGYEYLGRSICESRNVCYIRGDGIPSLLEEISTQPPHVLTLLFPDQVRRASLLSLLEQIKILESEEVIAESSYEQYFSVLKTLFTKFPELFIPGLSLHRVDGAYYLVADWAIPGNEDPALSLGKLEVGDPVIINGKIVGVLQMRVPQDVQSPGEQTIYVLFF